MSQNTYHTLKDLRVVFVDGTVLDTSDAASRAAVSSALIASARRSTACVSRAYSDAYTKAQAIFRRAPRPDQDAP